MYGEWKEERERKEWREKMMGRVETKMGLRIWTTKFGLGKPGENW